MTNHTKSTDKEKIKNIKTEINCKTTPIETRIKETAVQN